MASLGVGFTLPATKPTSSSSYRAGGRGRNTSVVAVGATRGTASSKGAKEEKGLLDFIFGAITKDEQMLETDPILNKVEDKTTFKPKPSVAAPAAKSNGGFGGLGGLFAKK